MGRSGKTLHLAGARSGQTLHLARARSGQTLHLEGPFFAARLGREATTAQTLHLPGAESGQTPSSPGMVGMHAEQRRNACKRCTFSDRCLRVTPKSMLCSDRCLSRVAETIHLRVHCTRHHEGLPDTKYTQSTHKIHTKYTKYTK